MGYIFPSLRPISWIPLSSCEDFAVEVERRVPVRTRIEIVEGGLWDVKMRGFMVVLLTGMLVLNSLDASHGLQGGVKLGKWREWDGIDIRMVPLNPFINTSLIYRQI
jgi:hypothetical protein